MSIDKNKKLSFTEYVARLEESTADRQEQRYNNGEEGTGGNSATSSFNTDAVNPDGSINTSKLNSGDEIDISTDDGDIETATVVSQQGTDAVEVQTDKGTTTVNQDRLVIPDDHGGITGAISDITGTDVGMYGDNDPNGDMGSHLDALSQDNQARNASSDDATSSVPSDKNKFVQSDGQAKQERKKRDKERRDHNKDERDKKKKGAPDPVGALRKSSGDVKDTLTKNTAGAFNKGKSLIKNESEDDDELLRMRKLAGIDDELDEREEVKIEPVVKDKMIIGATNKDSRPSAKLGHNQRLKKLKKKPKDKSDK